LPCCVIRHLHSFPTRRSSDLVDADENCYPDPASRFQPDGPHGASCIVDSTKFRWNDAEWPGLMLKGQILYEMHIGTFTQEGTWRDRKSTRLNSSHVAISYAVY